MTKSQKLLQRLRDLGLDIPADAMIRRSYAGHWQRSEGAWVWFVEILKPQGYRPLDVGSQYSVTQLLKGEIIISRDQFGQTHVDPKEGQTKA